MQATVEGEEMEVVDLVCGGVSRGRGDGCGSRGGVNQFFINFLSYYIKYFYLSKEGFS